LFTGSMLACGGAGFEAGGAGTVYLKANTQTPDQLTLNNCGASGEITPLSQTFGFAEKLVIGDGAIGQMQGTIPILSNLIVLNGGTLTGSATDAGLYLAVKGDVSIDAGGVMHVDGRGYVLNKGPGAGGTILSEGAGGGYGGDGGASASGAPGGAVYGSNSQPIDRGSGGGFGSGPLGLGSEGGGALRLIVSGHLAVDGLLSANGNDGLQDDSGGGAGGSLWVTAKNLTGAGMISAVGGAGELFNGGGGGGGRVAIYAAQNYFAGQFSVVGGSGTFPGETGTIFTSSSLPGFNVTAQSPTGLISSTINQLTLDFSGPVDPASLGVTSSTLVTPNGIVPSAAMILSAIGPSKVKVSFPRQNVPGDYRVQFGPGITDLLGQPLSQVYTGAFTMAIPVLAGTVRDTNGAPVAGVTLQQTTDPLLSTMTDANGAYRLGVDTGWSGTLTPAMAGFMFVPGSRAYSGVTGNISNEDYVRVKTIAPFMAGSLQGNNLALNWYGLAGVSYQTYYSTNLVDWQILAGPIAGTNGPAGIIIAVDPNDPMKFFSVGASN
jgi:hypothetical protein